MGSVANAQRLPDGGYVWRAPLASSRMGGQSGVAKTSKSCRNNIHSTDGPTGPRGTPCELRRGPTKP
eukprot:7780659-Pyramimonas_sp.AAC.1